MTIELLGGCPAFRNREFKILEVESKKSISQLLEDANLYEERAEEARREGLPGIAEGLIRDAEEFRQEIKQKETKFQRLSQQEDYLGLEEWLRLGAFFQVLRSYY